MSKEEILDYFRHINTVYNDCSMHDSLSNMLDEFEQETYGKGYNQGSIDRAEELQKCREYGYNKAIDEFAERLKSDEFQKYNLDMVFETSRDLSYSHCINAFCEYIDEIAEQLKGGAE